MAHRLQFPSECRYTLLRSFSIVLGIAVFLECCVVLVQWIIGQMCILIWFIASDELSILDCCQTNKAFLVDVDSQWIDAHECHIYTEVKLVAIQEQGVVNVLRDDGWLLCVAEFVVVVCYEDSSSLGWWTRFEYVVSLWVGRHSLLQLRQLMRKDVGKWHKREVLWSMLLSHHRKMLIKTILTTYLSGLWPMIHLLKSS